MSSRLCAISSVPSDEVVGADLILPCQYYDLSGGHRLSGEQRLMLALLTDAINVYQKGVLSRVARARRLYVDAERWIMAERENANSLSFVTVCEALGINATLLKRRIIAWKHAVSHQREDHPQATGTHLRITSRPRRGPAANTPSGQALAAL